MSDLEKRISKRGPSGGESNRDRSADGGVDHRAVRSIYGPRRRFDSRLCACVDPRHRRPIGRGGEASFRFAERTPLRSGGFRLGRNAGRKIVRERRERLRPTIHPHDLAKIGDDHMLGHVETENAQERADSKQPDIEGDAGYDAQHPRHAHLKIRSFHEDYYRLLSRLRKAPPRTLALSTAARKESESVPSSSKRSRTRFRKAGRSARDRLIRGPRAKNSHSNTLEFIFI